MLGVAVVGRLVALWLVLFALVVGLHVVAWGCPPAVAALAGWPVSALVWGLACGAGDERAARRRFALVAAAALVTAIALGLVARGAEYPRDAALHLVAALAAGCVAGSLPALWLGRRIAAWARPWRARRWVVRGALLAAVAAVAWGGAVYLRGLGLLAPGDRVATFDRLIATLAAQYSHWHLAPVGPAELVARWRPRVVAAAAACTADPCEPYLAALRDMLAELQDGHTSLWWDTRRAAGAPAVETGLVDEQLVITAVAPGSDAAHAGLRPGTAIGTVDGRPAAEAMAAVPAWRTAFSNPTTRRFLRAAHALDGPLGAPVAIDGVALARGRRPRRPLVEARFVEAGTLVVAIRGLTGGALVADFDRALDQPGVRAVVLDLRGNGGGDSGLGDRIAGRLVARPVAYGEECFRHGHPLRLWGVGCAALRVTPRGATFAGPVAVLLDTGVMSSAEWLAAALCDTGRARCFGRTTAGSSGNPLTFRVAGATVRYSTGAATRRDGATFERGGVPPHEPVTWHLADLVAGRDPDLDAARRWLAR